MGPIPDLTKYEKYEELTQGKLRYYESGTGRDILLLHGMGVYTTADTFLFMFERLAAKYHVMASDHFGFGKSSRILENGPSFDVIVDGYREFLYKKGIERVDIIGHSAGPWFGGILAYESPNLVRSLTAIGAAGLNVEAVARVANYSPPTKESLMDYIGGSLFPGSQMTKEKVEAMADMMLSYAIMPDAFEGLKPLVNQMATPGIRKSYLLQRRLPHLKMPSLWIWGKSEGIEPWPTWTKEWESIGHDPSRSSKPWVAPNATYHLLEQGTHNAHWEFPDEITDLCTHFIDSVPQ